MRFVSYDDHFRQNIVRMVQFICSLDELTVCRDRMLNINSIIIILWLLFLTLFL